MFFNFDINGTVIGFDSTNKGGNSYAVCESICRSMKGFVVNGKFLEFIEGTMTYYEYLKQFYPKDYRTRVGKLLDRCPHKVDLYDYLLPIFDQYFFPSFLRVIEKLKPEDKIIFRTFGHDGPEVISRLNEKYGLKFISLTSKWVNDQPKFFDSVGNEIDFLTIVEEKEHILIKDDYRYWNDHRRLAQCGKFIFPIPNQKQICFDDNDCMFTPDPQVQICRINTISAAIDQNYYVNLIK